MTGIKIIFDFSKKVAVSSLWCSQCLCRNNDMGCHYMPSDKLQGHALLQNSPANPVGESLQVEWWLQVHLSDSVLAIYISWRNSEHLNDAHERLEKKSHCHQFRLFPVTFHLSSSEWHLSLSQKERSLLFVGSFLSHNVWGFVFGNLISEVSLWAFEQTLVPRRQDLSLFIDKTCDSSGRIILTMFLGNSKQHYVSIHLQSLEEKV